MAQFLGSRGKSIFLNNIFKRYYSSKIVNSAEEAVKDIQSNSTLFVIFLFELYMLFYFLTFNVSLVGGFGLCGTPQKLIEGRIIFINLLHQKMLTF